MSYMNSVTLIGFVGADPEQQEAKANDSRFVVLSVATQRSWKNDEDEWNSKTEWHRVVIFRPRLAEFVAAKIRKGAHVLIEGSLVSSKYQQQQNGKGKKSKAKEFKLWSVRADVVRKLDRSEDPQTPAAEPAAESEDAPF
jgi:single-strand DNA-binding protein